MIVHPKMNPYSQLVNRTKQHEQTKKPFATNVLDSLNQFDPLNLLTDNNLTEEQISKKKAKIYTRLKSGKRLSGEDKSFLLKYDPAMYQVAKRIEAQREQLENQLKQARSKEEANDAISCAISGISQKDPYAEYVTAAIMDEAKEFKSSDQYKKLPTTRKEASKTHKKPTYQSYRKDNKSSHGNLYDKFGRLL